MRFRKSRYRKQIRTIPIRANDGDSGRELIDKGSYFRCWNCGFICDVRRDELSKDGRRGTVLTEGTSTSYGDTTLNYAVGDSVNIGAGVGHDIVLAEVGPDGTPVTVMHSYTVGGSGCPMCHTRVWKKP